MVSNFITGFFIVYLGCVLIDIVFIKLICKKFILKDSFADIICVLYGISAGVFSISNVTINNINTLIISISALLIIYIGHKINKIIGVKDVYTKIFAQSRNNKED